MIGTVIIAVFLVAVIGLLMRIYFNSRPDRGWFYERHISWREYVVGVLVLAPLASWAIVAVGNNLSIASTLRYEEFYNGVEIATLHSTTECYAGRAGNSASSGKSNCHHTYVSGRYTYWDTCPRTETYTDADGNIQTRTVWEPCLKSAKIYTPYATLETKYRITDTLGGEHRFAATYVPDNGRPFMSGTPIPGNVPRGAPAEWLESRALILAKNPRDITRLFPYDNYILAAQEDLLLPFSQDVEGYLAEKILPDHTANINDDPLSGFNHSYAEKVSFVGVTVEDETAWQDSLMGFNAALGMKLRGDAHMVLVDSNLVDNPERYINALKAYWLDDEYFGRRAIAKNAIIIVIGAKDGHVEWARATTGMPFGNETMTRHIQDFMHGVELKPEVVIGDPRTVFTPATSEGEDDKVAVTLSEQPGVLEDVVFELAPFARACMSCQDDEDAGQLGYDNLVAKIRPPFWQQALMVAIVALVSVPWWLFVARQTLFERHTSDPDYRRKTNHKYDRRYRY